MYGSVFLGTAKYSGDVTMVGEGTFMEGGTIYTIELPRTVTSIGDFAFFRCSLFELRIQNPTPPILGNECFYESGLQQISVPKESVDIYKTAEGWREFADIIQPIP